MFYKYNIENRRYTGSKEKLKLWIFELINKHCQGTSFLDLFAGTGVMSAEALKYYNKIIINDLLYSNEVIYNAFFLQSQFSEEKLTKYANLFNELIDKNIEDNFFSNNFGDKYFSKNDSKKIWFIRGEIEKAYLENLINQKEYYILLASLIYSSDKIADTVGHYDAYFKNKIKFDRFIFNLIKPLKIDNKTEILISRKDSNTLANEIQADIVYIDPPYNSRQYSRFYHVLETIIDFKEKELFGVAMKPEPQNMSEYCKKNAPAIFDDLIQSLKSKYIIVSYNNTYNSKSGSSKNKITLEEIKDSLSKRGKVLEFEKEHKHFNAGNTNFNNHLELIFLVKVEN